MKAHVYVTLKHRSSTRRARPSTTRSASRICRRHRCAPGQIFALSLADGLQADAARAEVERIAREVLTNPVIEEFTYRIEE